MPSSIFNLDIHIEIKGDCMRFTKALASILAGTLLMTVIPTNAYAADYKFNSNTATGSKPQTTTPVYGTKPKDWEINQNPNDITRLPQLTYDVSPPSGELDIRVSPSTEEPTKGPVTVSVHVHQDKKFDIRYADVPTPDYKIETESETTHGDATIITKDTSVNFNGSGVMSGTSNGQLSAGGSGSTTIKPSVDFTGEFDLTPVIEAWHGSGGYWKFTYESNRSIKNFTLYDSQIPTYFTGTQKEFTEDMITLVKLPTKIINHANKYGLGSIKFTVTPKTAGSIKNNKVTATLISADTLKLVYRPVFNYETNNWWSGSPVQNHFTSWVNMPKVKDGFGSNYLSILEGEDKSLRLTNFLKGIMYKMTNGNLGFNTDKSLDYDYTYLGSDGNYHVEKRTSAAKDLWVSSSVWSGGNMGAHFDYPINVTYEGIVPGENDSSLVGQTGILTGNASGSVSGTASKDFAVYEKNEDGEWVVVGYETSYKGISSGVSGPMVTGSDVDLSGSFTGNASSNITAEYNGTLKGGHTLTGWTTQELLRYNMSSVPGTVYKKPYTIPIATQITLPDGTAVDGVDAEFTVEENGKYTVTAKDGRGNTVSTSITVTNIDKGRIDVEEYYIEKVENGEALKKQLSVRPIDEVSVVRAQVLEEPKDALADVTYGFFLRVKETLLGFNTDVIDQFGSMDLSIVNAIDSSISDSIAKQFYNVDTSLTEKIDSSLFRALKAKQDGIYVSSTLDNGYRILFFKDTKTYKEEMDKYIKIQFRSNAGDLYDTVTRLQIESTPKSYITSDSNYILSDDFRSTLIFSRNADLKLNQITTLYDSKVTGINSKIISIDSTDNRAFDQVLYTSSSFKEDVIYPMNLTFKGLGYRNYTVKTNVNSYEDKNSILDLYGDSREMGVDVVYEPIDTLINTTTLKTNKSTNSIAVSFTARVKSDSKITALLNKYGLKPTDIKYAVVNYGSKKDSGAVNITDYATEYDLLYKSNYTEGSNISLNTTTAEDIRLVVGIPGVFVDSIGLEQNTDLSIPNINDNTPTIIDINPDKPYIVNLLVEVNDYIYTLPQDFDKLKSDAKVRSVIVNGKDYIAESKDTLAKALSITSEGTYNYDATISTIYGATRTASKTAILIDSNTLIDGSRLNNDSTIVITKQGLYDLQTGTYAPYSIGNEVTENTGYSIKGIRLVNNNICIINTSSNEGQMYNASLESIGVFKLNSTALDLIEYRDRIYFAEGNTGLSYVETEKYTTNTNTKPVIDNTVSGPVYALETYSSTLIVGSDKENALRTYRLNSGVLEETDKISAEDVYGDASLKVYDLVIRNGRLEVFPDHTDFHIIIDLP